MAQFGVTPETLKKVAGNLAELSSEMQTITSNMSNLIEEIKKAWPDENGLRYTERFETEVESQFSKYYNAVKEYSDFINRASSQYQATNERVNATITRSA